MSNTEKDYLLQIKVKNAHIMRILKSKGMNQADLARASNVNPTTVGAICALKTSPYKVDGDYKPSVIAICEALNVMPVQLFPRRLLTIPKDKKMAELEVNIEELVSIENGESDLEQKVINDQRSAIIDDAIKTLPERAQDMLEMLHNNYTLEDIGAKHNVTRERVRQIIHKCYRDLKPKLTSKGVKI